MIVYIKDKQLIKLYETGKPGKLKLPSDIVDKFLATVQKIESAVSIHDFWKDPSLRFERLKGYKNRYSMRLSIKYRLEMEVTWNNSVQTTGEFLIIAISLHYRD